MRLWLLLPFASSASAPERCEVFDDEEGLRLLQHQAAALPTGPCSAGQGRPAPGAPCLPCTEGTWSSTGSCLSCVAGTWSDLRGATSAESCQHCPEGTWSSQVGATALQAREGTAWSVQIIPGPPFSWTHLFGNLGVLGNYGSSSHLGCSWGCTSRTSRWRSAY